MNKPKSKFLDFPECYHEDEMFIHKTNLVGEDDEYYYTVPIKAMKKIPKEEVEFELRPMVKTKVIKALKNKGKFESHTHRVMIEEITEELLIEQPELFI